LIFSGAAYHKLDHPGYYDLLVKNKEIYPEKFFMTIEKDIKRTYIY
jgi:hypothetical protein